MVKEIATQEFILHLVDLFMNASIKKDRLFMQDYLHPHFLFATPRGTLFTYETFFREFLSNTKFTLLQFERLQQEVTLARGLALMNGIVKAQFKGAEEQYERISFLWIPGPNDWSLLHIHSTYTTKPF